MVILIGGIGYAGKTLMAQRLLEKYKYPYFSIDHLKMGIYRADNSCGFTPEDSTEHIGEKLWPILKGIIMTNIENNQNLIIEGLYILPKKLSELDDEYLRDIISFYFYFSEDYIKNNFQSQILRNRKIIEARDDEVRDTAEDYIKENIRYKSMCQDGASKCFEISNDYEAETGAIYSWLDDEISKRRQKSESSNIKLGEVCLLTGDVVGLSSFYKTLLKKDNGSESDIHQFIISEETMLTIYNDGTPRSKNHDNILIAFTVSDIDAEFERLTALGVTIIDPPTLRPWGAKNMMFQDPDGNRVVFRSFPK